MSQSPRREAVNTIKRVLAAAGFTGLRSANRRIDGVKGIALYVTHINFAKTNRTRRDVIEQKEASERGRLDEWAAGPGPDVALIQPPVAGGPATDYLVTMRLPAFGRLLKDAQDGRKIKEAEDARNGDR